MTAGQTGPNDAGVGQDVRLPIGLGVYGHVVGLTVVTDVMIMQKLNVSEVPGMASETLIQVP
jgi:hypothetical protein